MTREIKEETGLRLVRKPKLIAAQDILRNPNCHIVRLTYLGVAEGEVKLDGSEHDMYKWYSFDELRQLEDLDVYFKELLDTVVWSENIA